MMLYDLDAMADQINLAAANAHFADGDDADYCSECGEWVDEDDRVMLGDDMYCRKCIRMAEWAAEEAADGQV